MAEPLDRFRSFTERYIIERATHFEIGREQEQAWLALQDAKQIYDMIGTAAVAREPVFMAGGTAQAPPSQAGVTGPYGPVGPVGNPGNMAARNAAMAAKMPSPVAPSQPAFTPGSGLLAHLSRLRKRGGHY